MPDCPEFYFQLAFTIKNHGWPIETMNVTKRHPHSPLFKCIEHREDVFKHREARDQKRLVENTFITM